MQGQRGIIGSLPESLDFDHVSSSGNAVVGQQIFWNDVRNSSENGLADFIHLNDGMVNSATISQERQGVGGWSLGEPSSSAIRNEGIHSGPKGDHAWSSTVPCIGSGSRLEEARCGQTSGLSFESGNMSRQYIHSHNSDAISQNLNLNPGFVDHGNDNFPLTVDPNGYKTSGGDSGRPSSAAPTPFIPSRSGRLMLGDNEDRPGCSLDACRQSCKRKAIEGTSGQSSVSGISPFFQTPEGSSWPHIPARYDSNSSLGMSVSSQSAIPRLGLCLRGGSSECNFSSPTVVQPEGSHRSFRLRINPSNQEPVSTPFLPTSSTVRHSVVPIPHQSSRHLSHDHYDPGSSSATVSVGNQSQQSVLPVSTLQNNAQSLRWHENLTTRDGNSLTPINLADREEVNPRNVPRNLLEHPIPLPMNGLRSTTRNLIARNVGVGIASTGASSSHSSSGSGQRPLTGPGWIPTPHVSSRSSRRLAEFVRRSMFSSTIAESGQGDIRAPLPMRPSPEEAAVAGNPVHHRSLPRSASWIERQGDSLLGIPYPLRSFTTGNEGRRHVSEQIRNVLDIMRRGGEGLRFEDVMILDQSVFFGVTDIHDRHRDMRLDVDNMSYEELLALEERIGNVSTGLSEEAIFKLLKRRIYSDALRVEVKGEPCCVCQEEYKDAENLGTLDCGHNFHTDCIKQWLMHKNWCPICKTTGLAT